MSEAVVDDIVAVLPPLLQSLEALGFVARHLHPPVFGSVMEAAGHARPGADARCGRGWPIGLRNFPTCRASLAAASDAALAAYAEDCARSRHGEGDLLSVFRALRQWLPGAGGAVSAGGEIAAGEQTFSSIPLAARIPSCRGAPRRPGHRENTGIIHDQQRAWQPRRLLALRAGILHAGPGLAAGDGVAWRQRQRPRLSVELAARRPQPRRHPGRADGNAASTWALMGEDPIRRTSPAFSISPRPLEHRSGPAAADRNERRRHVLLCHRARACFALHPSCSGRRHVSSVDGRDRRRRDGCAACRSISCMARLDWMFPVQMARQTRDGWRRPAPKSPIARSRISAIAIRARSMRRSWTGSKVRQADPHREPILGRDVVRARGRVRHADLLGMILGAVMLVAGVYIADTTSTSRSPTARWRSQPSHHRQLGCRVRATGTRSGPAPMTTGSGCRRNNCQLNDRDSRRLRYFRPAGRLARIGDDLAEFSMVRTPGTRNLPTMNDGVPRNPNAAACSLLRASDGVDRLAIGGEIAGQPGRHRCRRPLAAHGSAARSAWS